MTNNLEKSVILRAKGICKSFYTPKKTSILKGVDFVAHAGETIAIMGRSGEGKSTLLHILGTLDSPCQGSLEIANQDVSHFNKSLIRNRHIGFVFQSFHLLEDYTALENVLMPARIARKPIHPNSTAYNHAIKLLDQVGLSSRMHFYTKLLSGGEKQRVAIARALCNNPDLIFADEPSGNLDRHNAEYIHQVLLDFAKEHNKTLIVVTHDQELANLCDQVYSLREGRLD